MAYNTQAMVNGVWLLVGESLDSHRTETKIRSWEAKGAPVQVTRVGASTPIYMTKTQ